MPERAVLGPVPWWLSLWDQVKPAGELCRHAKDGCDLEEFCDGQHPMCPEDAFQENGTPCQGGYCFNGNCPTMTHRCKELWGSGEADISMGHMASCWPWASAWLIPSGPIGAWPATDACFTNSLLPGCNVRTSVSINR